MIALACATLEKLERQRSRVVSLAIAGERWVKPQAPDTDHDGVASEMFCALHDAANSDGGALVKLQDLIVELEALRAVSH
ncbi:hypothetical protein [Paraburkholderia sp. RL17-381-BIF-C]|uniref:hypothetical protein n=1 Tax=Paraburkholderia sp. RL17-381-BIF-C TaxID=3031635 RepID=UPI0038B79F56